MKKQSSIEGVYTALVTPFDEKGNIDWDSFEKLMQHQIDGQIDGVVVNGTTGESPTVSVQEKIALIRKARTFLPPTIKVMAGSGGSSTEQSIELSKLSADAGADSLLIVTPPYNKPGVRGLKEHFKAICRSIEIEACLYHVPGRTGQVLTPSDLASIAEIENITAIKEASGQIDFFTQTLLNTEVNILSGDDPSFLASLSVGGHGVISVVTNIFPGFFKKIHEAYQSGNTVLAKRLNTVLYPLILALFYEPNPTPCKLVLSHLNLCKNTLRLPLVPVSSSLEQKIISSYSEANKLLESMKIDPNGEKYD